MMQETQPSSVSATTTQGGDIQSRWPWVEPKVWTDRMLTALETGVKGGVWSTVAEQVLCEVRALQSGKSPRNVVSIP